MPSLKINDLNEILNLLSEDIKKFEYFVETGTYHGDTIVGMSNHFNKLFTIELSLNLYERFQKRDYDKQKIKSILGDSSQKISEVISELQGDAIFFLDGHFSSCGTAKGNKDVPLIEEIESINNLFKFSGIIIIDDFRLFGTKKSEDWSYITVESVTTPISERIITTFNHNDRLIIKIK
jgi:hypothetical protein